VSAPRQPGRDPLALLRPRPRSFGDPIVRSWRLAVAGLVVAAIAALLVKERGGLLALGVLLGVFAASGFALLLAMLRPVGALVTTARPLGVAALLILAAGTIDSPVVLQLLAGMTAMLVGLSLLVRPEWPQLVRALDTALKPAKTPEEKRRQRHWIALLAVGSGLVVLLALLLPPGDSLEARGGLAAFLFALAVVLLGVSILLRLLGYSRTIVRLPVAVLMVLAGVRLAMSAGLLPGDDTFEHVTATVLVALAGVGLLIAVGVDTWSWVSAQHAADPESLQRAIALEQPVIPRVITDGASAFGIIAGLIASVVLLLAMVFSANPGAATGAIADSLEARAPGPPPAGFASMDDEALGHEYAPLLLFSSASRWSPVSVDDYLSRAGSSLKVRDWEKQTVDPEELPSLGDCPTIVPVPCYTISTGCTQGDAPCGQSISAPADGERREDGTVYVRVIRRGRARPDRSPNAFDDVGPYGSQVQTIVQYWFFYAFDDWISPVIAGQLRQYHEADWEAVTIGLSGSEPLFVGFSQHCGGEWYPWKDVRVTAGTRTVVAVAEGSQANYRFPNPSQAPDWTGCANLPARTTTLVSYASNIRDRTSADWSWSPPATGFEFVDARKFPMNVVARWAPYSRTELQTLHKTHPLGADAAGPATPSTQRLWREPMRTIFGGGTWHRGSE
jgi:hypothetical protein